MPPFKRFCTNGSHRINKPFIHIKVFLYLLWLWRIKRKNPTTFLASQTEMGCATLTLLFFIFKHEGWGFTTFFVNYSLKNLTENFYINETIACCIWRFFRPIRRFDSITLIFRIEAETLALEVDWVLASLLSAQFWWVSFVHDFFAFLTNLFPLNCRLFCPWILSCLNKRQWNNFRLFGNKQKFGVINHEERENYDGWLPSKCYY
jgi:hypothetical protein